MSRTARWGIVLAGGLAAVATGWLVRNADAVAVRGVSMSPALRPGDRLLVVRLRRTARAGEIVLAPDPRDGGRELIKRVAAVGSSGVTLLGDDATHSTDGRTFGPVPAETVRWRAVVRYWPLGRVGRLPPPQLGPLG